MGSEENVRYLERAIHEQKEARSLRSAAEGIDASSNPDPLAAEFMRYDAAKLEQVSADALALNNKPPVGTGGELVPEGDQIKRGGGNFIDTVERPDAVTAAASMDRLKLTDEGIDCVAMAVDAAETIQATNSIEKMLVHQLAAAHKLAMTFAGNAQRLIEEDGIGWTPKPTIYATEASRVANASAKMMDAFQKGTLALHKLRTGGKQIVTVQHVNVSEGGQAVVAGGISQGVGDEN
jgi:hypothetical protein